MAEKFLPMTWLIIKNSRLNLLLLLLLLQPRVMPRFYTRRYREVFNSLDVFTALRFTAVGVLPTARSMQILSMNQPITSGMKGIN
jgi:hypothetical protein